MKRNWDVLRTIMVNLEEVPTESGQLNSNAILGVDNETAYYHMRMLIEAGFAEGGCPEVVGQCFGYLSRLTREGHELLDQIRRDRVWNRVKEIARTKSVDLSVDVIRAIARSVIDGMLG